MIFPLFLIAFQQLHDAFELRRVKIVVLAAPVAVNAVLHEPEPRGLGTGDVIILLCRFYFLPP